jgi:hypothetical protein
MHQRHIGSVQRYERLSRLRGYTVDRHQDDPRKWKVVNRDGHAIGDVRDLIVDTERMTGAYLELELDRKLFELRGDPHVLVPMALAQRDGGHHRVIVDGLSRDRVAGLAAARWEQEREFWDRWWKLDDERLVQTLPTSRPEDLRRAVDEVRPGETMRIPVVNEEIVVERRPVAEPTLIARDK